jgi:hypothetical protein
MHLFPFFPHSKPRPLPHRLPLLLTDPIPSILQDLLQFHLPICIVNAPDVQVFPKSDGAEDEGPDVDLCGRVGGSC